MKIVVSLFALGISVFTAYSATHETKPNVVCILADDLGWSDIGAHPGGSISTLGPALIRRTFGTSTLQITHGNRPRVLARSQPRRGQ